MKNFALTKGCHRHGARNCRTDNIFIRRQILAMENASARSANPSFSQRYLDPKYSRWMSCDPKAAEYMDGKDANSTSGGIYSLANFNLYHYSNNNPVKYVDPNGKDGINYEYVKYLKDNDISPSQATHQDWENFNSQPQVQINPDALNYDHGAASDFYDKASAVTGDLSVAALAAGQPEAAAVLGTTSIALEGVAFGEAVMSGDNEKIKSTGKSFGRALFFNKIGNKLFPGWDKKTGTFRNPQTGKFVSKQAGTNAGMSLSIAEKAVGELMDAEPKQQQPQNEADKKPQETKQNDN